MIIECDDDKPKQTELFKLTCLQCGGDDTKVILDDWVTEIDITIRCEYCLRSIDFVWDKLYWKKRSGKCDLKA